MRFIVTRHGQTEWNRMRKIQGITDIPLNETGRQQAEQLSNYLVEHYGPIQAIYSSPLLRAVETARICAEPWDVPVQLTDDLLEIRLGDWEGLTFEEIGERHPEQMRLWETEPHHCKIPGDSEAISVIWDRLLYFFDRLKEMHEPTNDTILCVTHHMPARIIMAQHFGIPIENMRVLRINNASVNIIEWTPKQTIVQTLNERPYLNTPRGERW